MATNFSLPPPPPLEIHATIASEKWKWAQKGNENKIEPVLKRFGEYCEPRKTVPFERYRFNGRMQEPGETYEQYRTALRKIETGCNFDFITPDDFLRDRLVFGIRDNKVREWLLREANLSLAKTDEICPAAEGTRAQMKIVGGEVEPEANKVEQERGPQKFRKNSRRRQQLGEVKSDRQVAVTTL